MAKITIELNADKYYNCEALHDIATEIECGDYITEDDKPHVYRIEGEHFEAEMIIQPSEA